MRRSLIPAWLALRTPLALLQSPIPAVANVMSRTSHPSEFDPVGERRPPNSGTTWPPAIEVRAPPREPASTPRRPTKKERLRSSAEKRSPTPFQRRWAATSVPVTAIAPRGVELFSLDQPTPPRFVGTSAAARLCRPYDNVPSSGQYYSPNCLANAPGPLALARLASSSAPEGNAKSKKHLDFS